MGQKLEQSNHEWASLLVERGLASHEWAALLTDTERVSAAARRKWHRPEEVCETAAPAGLAKPSPCVQLQRTALRLGRLHARLRVMCPSEEYRGSDLDPPH